MSKIELKNVSKTFGDVEAVKNVSLSFEQNKIYGLLGRNGAGKSTLLNMITSRIFPDAGEITLDGEQAIENDTAMQKMYLMGETNLYPDSMRLKEAFRIARTLYPDFNRDNTDNMLNAFGLSPEKKVKALSTGMCSMFRLIMAFSTGAPYIFLDEPVLGLDAVHREQFYKMLAEQFEKKPACYVISTHLIEEVAGLIENVIIIDSGEILLQEETENLLARGYTVTGPEAVVNDYITRHNCVGHDQLGGMKSAYILGDLDKERLPEALEVTKLNLQQLFVQLTKGGRKNDFS